MHTTLETDNEIDMHTHTRLYFLIKNWRVVITLIGCMLITFYLCIGQMTEFVPTITMLPFVLLVLDLRKGNLHNMKVTSVTRKRSMHTFKCIRKKWPTNPAFTCFLYMTLWCRCYCYDSRCGKKTFH